MTENHGSKARILLIEDTEIVRALLREYLENVGYSVIEAGNGRQGLQQFWTEPTDVVITDMEMPEGNGAEAIQELRGHFPMVKIIAMSSDLGLLELACRLGVQRIFRKPFALPELLAAVQAFA